MNRFSVSSVSAPSETYSALFVASGAEERCTHLFRKFAISAARKLAIYYDRESGPRVRGNHERFKKANFVQAPFSGDGLKRTIFQLIESLPVGGRVCVDISCLTRECLAYWVYAILRASIKGEVEIEFFYSHARYSPPPKSCGLAKSPGPMIPEFAGFFSDPRKPSLLLLGLGYEPHLALSFWELLDPAQVIAFIPQHHDVRYAKAIDTQNETFLEYVSNERTIHYDVFDPMDAFAKVEASIASAQDAYRVNLAPYGPKLFVLSSILAAALYFPRVFLWHLNSDVPVVPTPNRVASGRVNGLKVVLSQKGTIRRDR